MDTASFSWQQIKRFIRRNFQVLTFMAATMGVVIPFWFEKAGLVIFVGIFFTALMLKSMHESLKPKYFIGFTWLWGLLVDMLITSWILFTKPDQWTPANGFTATFLLATVFVIFNLILSIQYLAFGFYIRHIGIWRLALSYH